MGSCFPLRKVYYTTQGNPLTMLMHALATFPLIRHLSDTSNSNVVHKGGGSTQKLARLYIILPKLLTGGGGGGGRKGVGSLCQPSSHVHIILHG